MSGKGGANGLNCAFNISMEAERRERVRGRQADIRHEKKRVAIPEMSFDSNARQQSQEAFNCKAASNAK